jgi:CRISPR-associated protein Cmr6
MVFAKAFQKTAQKKPDKAAQLGIDIKPPARADQWGTTPEAVPMMYRAQVMGRCSLHNAKKENQDLNNWTKQWTYPHEQGPQKGEARYQRSPLPLGQDGDVYRIEVEFPFRLFSNGGQDSIMRPMLGKDGIPFLPGSSVKGLFLRGCNADQAQRYCGQTITGDTAQAKGKLQHLPGTLKFRFHGAYPLGDWSSQIVDLVHPQGNRQIGTNPLKQTKDEIGRANVEESASASALISLYRPQMVFEFSCSDPTINWKEVEDILRRSLLLGVGGKTSSGYGLGGNFVGRPPINPTTRLNFLLKGEGVSSVLRDDVTPEFRVNLFKASLRGHLRRLLGGVSQKEEEISRVVARWFGDTRQPARVQIFWQQRRKPLFADTGRDDRNPTYDVDGMLYLDIPQLQPKQSNTPEDQAQNRREQEKNKQDLALLEQVLTFAYVMGGFGKSWRRVWHKQFMPDYHGKKFAIGCHWQSSDLDLIQTEADLDRFLTQLHQQCVTYLNARTAQAMDWREAWNPNRVAVYCRKGSCSEAVALFHDDIFKTTPAIGGRKPHAEHPDEFNPPQNTSSVWHRMLPLKNGTEFLEIVTVFHGDRTSWKRDGIDQLLAFIQALKDRGLKLGWGTEPKP